MYLIWPLPGGGRILVFVVCGYREQQRITSLITSIGGKRRRSVMVSHGLDDWR